VGALKIGENAQGKIPLQYTQLMLFIIEFIYFLDRSSNFLTFFEEKKVDRYNIFSLQQFCIDQVKQAFLKYRLGHVGTPCGQEYSFIVVRLQGYNITTFYYK